MNEIDTNLRNFTFECSKISDIPPMWIGECDELHICTEAESYPALVERINLIAPDMARELGFTDENEGGIRVYFKMRND